MLSIESLKTLYSIIHNLNSYGEEWWGSNCDIELEEELFVELQKQLGDEGIDKYFDEWYIERNNRSEYKIDYLKKYNKNDEERIWNE